MTATAPDAAVAAQLTGQTLGSVLLTSGTNLFTGPVRPNGSGVPLLAVFCLATGGPENTPYVGGGESWQVRSVQVRIRSAPQAYATGQALATAAIGRIHDASLAGYSYCNVREPWPVYLGQSATGAHEWSFNVMLGLAE